MVPSEVEPVVVVSGAVVPEPVLAVVPVLPVDVSVVDVASVVAESLALEVLSGLVVALEDEDDDDDEEDVEVDVAEVAAVVAWSSPQAKERTEARAQAERRRRMATTIADPRAALRPGAGFASLSSETTGREEPVPS